MGKSIITGTGVPIWSWLPPDDIEPAAMDQLQSAATHPDAALRLAVMPDCHVGFGVTIGSVLPTVNAVLPNAVGVDIGCGMCAIDTGVPLTDEMGQPFWRAWSGNVRRNVPSGFQTHSTNQPLDALDRPLRARTLNQAVMAKASRQIGTLGGGNHFLEAQADERGIVWLMVHSGSRHGGLRIANHYNELAGEISARRGVTLPKDLAALPLDDQTGQDYLHDMNWATDFALENRLRMLDAMLASFWQQLDQARLPYRPVDSGSRINIHHPTSMRRRASTRTSRPWSSASAIWSMCCTRCDR